MQRVKQLAFFSIFILLLQFNSVITVAHNGARDELGGHFRSSDCMYLLHEPTSLAKTVTTLEELLLLIQQYNSNTNCTSSLTVEKIDLEGYILPTGQPNSTPTSSSNIQSEDLLVGKKYSATLEKCTDGDTANFMINGSIYKTRFLYIDTPESTREIEPYGKEASEFTCSLLKTGEITLETDGNNLFDKYGRLLAWVWVNELLVQEEITKAGLVKDFFDYGDYKYEDRILSAMAEAKENFKGMYAAEKAPLEKVEIEEQAEELTENAAKEPVSQSKSDNSNSTITPIILAVLVVLVFALGILIKRFS